MIEEVIQLSQADFTQSIFEQIVHMLLAWRNTELQFRDIIEQIVENTKKENAVFKNEDYIMVQDIVKDLLARGILVLGSNQDNFSWAWLRVTDTHALFRLAEELKLSLKKTD